MEVNQRIHGANHLKSFGKYGRAESSENLFGMAWLDLAVNKRLQANVGMRALMSSAILQVS